VQIAGLHHVAINVADVDEAVDFYRTVLGFSVIESRPDFGFPGAWLQAGANQVHLILAPEGFEPDRAQHYALQIDDADAWAAHLDELGVQHRRSPYRAGAGQQIVVKDPTGNRIELNQPDRVPASA
jgi:glyoxylase I family protein